MNFSIDKLKNFSSSLNFLIDTMVQSGKYLYRQQGMVEKPFWLVQSEVFSSFFEKIKHNEQGVDKLKNDVVKPIYEEYEINFNTELIDSSNKVQDDFLKVDINKNELKVVNASGLVIKAGKGLLPFSDVYSHIIKNNKDKNSPYPLLLLIGLYGTVFNAVKDQETVETINIFKKNIQNLIDGLESCDGMPKRKEENNPMSMLKNMLSSFNFKEMLGDDKMGKDFGDVITQMQGAMSETDNPMEAMGKVFKNISSKMNEYEQSKDPDIPVEKVSENVSFTPELSKINKDDIEEIE